MTTLGDFLFLLMILSPIFILLGFVVEFIDRRRQARRFKERLRKSNFYFL